jgi:CotS family spore coat protein
MNRFKYVDKDILCIYNLSEELFSMLGVDIYDIIPLRKVFVLFTNKGKKILKIANSTKERIQFIDKVLRYIEKKDKNVLKYCENIEGDIITTWDDKDYILLDMIDGREACYTNPIDITLCAEAISKMHKASYGLDSFLDEKEKLENSSKSIIDQYKSDFNTICEFENMINKFKYKNEFDLLFLDIVDKCKSHMNKAIDLLQCSSYKELNKFKANLVLCHNDLAHHNFIVNDTDVNIIDFDYCSIDAKIIDIANFAGKVMKNTFYDINILDSILKSYGQVSREEVEVLYALFTYPKDFVNIVKSYYLKQKSWSEEVFIGRFKNKIELDIFRDEFLVQFKDYYR